MFAPSDLDREFFDRELAGFVPDKVFDAHAHLWDKDTLKKEELPQLFLDAGRAGIDEYKAWMLPAVPAKEWGGLFFGIRAADASDRFVADECQKSDRCLPQIFVRPDMSEAFVRARVRELGAVGLKCYHVYAPTRPTWDAEIDAYLPEKHVRVAHDLGLTVTLHMVKARALADPKNQEIIRDFCTRYPNMRLILAHAARGFNPNHTIQGIESLRGLNNVWCDTSAVTDGGAFEAILDVLGPRRLLYGSDFPVSHTRGRCIAIGDSFVWIMEDTLDWERIAPYGELRPVMVGLESLRVLKQACHHARLTDADVEAIFWENARRLWFDGV